MSNVDHQNMIFSFSDLNSFPVEDSILLDCLCIFHTKEKWKKEMVGQGGEWNLSENRFFK